VVLEWPGQQPDAGDAQRLLLDLVDRGIIRILTVALRYDSFSPPRPRAGRHAIVRCSGARAHHPIGMIKDLPSRRPQGLRHAPAADNPGGPAPGEWRSPGRRRPLMSPTCLAAGPPQGVARPRRVVRFARLIHRRDRAPGPAGLAAPPAAAVSAWPGRHPRWRRLVSGRRAGVQSADVRPSEALNLAALIPATILVAPEVLQGAEARRAGDPHSSTRLRRGAGSATDDGRGGRDAGAGTEPITAASTVRCDLRRRRLARRLAADPW
jgi:hypothetical protein